MPTKSGRLLLKDIKHGRRGWQVDTFLAKGDRLITAGIIRSCVFTGRPYEKPGVAWVVNGLDCDGLPSMYYLERLGIETGIKRSDRERRRHYTFSSRKRAISYLSNSGAEILSPTEYMALVDSTMNLEMESAQLRIARNSIVGKLGTPQPIDLEANMRRVREIRQELQDGLTPQQRGSVPAEAQAGA